MTNLQISTSIVQNAVQFCMSGKLTGWAGIGFGPAHQAMDTYVGWVTSSGYAVLQEGYSNSFDIPQTDSKNCAQIVSYSQTLTDFRMCFKRSLNTGKAGDTIFTLGDSFIAYWAYHMNVNPESTSSSVRYAQHTHTGSRQITLPKPIPTPSPTRSLNPKPTPRLTSTPTLGTPIPAPTVVPTPVSTSLLPTPVYSPVPISYLQADENFYVSWEIQQNKIRFNYDCNIDGWVGIGFDTASKIHKSTDTYISWILSSGTGIVQDGYSSSETKPDIDTVQSAVVLNASRVENRFKLSFERLLDTGDTRDLPLHDWLLMGWAYHPTANPDTLDISQANIPIHTRRGSLMINLRTGESIEQKEPLKSSVYYLITVLSIFCLFSLSRYRKRRQEKLPNGFYKGSQFEPYNHTRVWLESRIPLLNISRIDLFIGICILILNIGCVVLGTRLGFSQSQVWGDLSAANSLLVAIPVTRNSIITWVTKVPFDQTIKYHRWLGRLTILQGVIHFACSIDYPDFSWTLDNYYGFISVICLGIIALTSVEYIRRQMFNLFFYSHHILFVYYVFGSLHSKSFFVYTCIAAGIYGFDRLIRLLRGIYPRKIINAERLSDRILKLRFSKNKYHSQKIAQYAFLNFPKINLLEWHPFTLVNGPDESFHEVYIKSLGDYTSDIVEKISTGDWLRMDGPYGHWSFEHKNYSHILFVCGGIGITPCISFIRHVYSKSETSKEFNHIRHIYLVWCSSSEKEAEWVNRELLRVIENYQDPKYPSFYLYVFITGQSAVKNKTYFIGRPDMDMVFDTAETRMLDEHTRACVFVCGPKTLSQQVWDTWSHRATHKRYDFRQEIFEF
jgi:predicted ferric reductase